MNRLGLPPGKLPFVKGHGTENDFVILPDSQAALDLDAALVRAICDRRAGIGADGVLRVVRSDGGWFMDYRNADGSIVETCGNGIRVFARYLVDAGLAASGRVQVGTRGGVRLVDVPADGADISVGMGPPEWLPDATVVVNGERLAAIGVSMGNPHLVAMDSGDPDRWDLAVAPQIAPAGAYPDGVNVEFVQRTGSASLRMRVHERGVGETRSCGTGACAAAVAAMRLGGERTAYDVDVPGGRLRINWTGDEVVLSGPALLVARGEIDVPSLLAACHDAG